MLAGLYQDRVRNTDQKANAVKVYEGKTSLQYRDAKPSRPGFWSCIDQVPGQIGCHRPNRNLRYYLSAGPSNHF